MYAILEVADKGKPCENMGRKATNLRQPQMRIGKVVGLPKLAVKTKRRKKPLNLYRLFYIFEASILNIDAFFVCH